MTTHDVTCPVELCEHTITAGPQSVAVLADHLTGEHYVRADQLLALLIDAGADSEPLDRPALATQPNRTSASGQPYRHATAGDVVAGVGTPMCGAHVTVQVVRGDDGQPRRAASVLQPGAAPPDCAACRKAVKRRELRR
ncbi:hypothetical protein CLV30_12870 [Haloactinopolyspora alba]|uniref:Uncharacterized protein n=1 Tax=Haloactinopolyspora alba TaxID=648780 RepID=A0A2P8DF42_9ACTN|nr:hypothetical protein [Haloactinopolyspora alba]PSK95818.1 hypothetical protein CLV30_12870 [Haloactinopolyspora alba]